MLKSSSFVELSCCRTLLFRSWELLLLVLQAATPWFCTPSQQYLHPLALLSLPIHDSAEKEERGEKKGHYFKKAENTILSQYHMWEKLFHNLQPTVEPSFLTKRLNFKIYIKYSVFDNAIHITVNNLKVSNTTVIKNAILVGFKLQKAVIKVSQRTVMCKCTCVSQLSQ